MQGLFAAIVAIARIIIYFLERTPSKTKLEVVREIWNKRKEKRDEAIINNQNDQISTDTSDIINGLDGLPKKDSSSPPK